VSKIDSTMINVNEASSRLNDNLEVLNTTSVSEDTSEKQERKNVQEK
jgi:hypothetical protein